MLSEHNKAVVSIISRMSKLLVFGNIFSPLKNIGTTFIFIFKYHHCTIKNHPDNSVTEIDKIITLPNKRDLLSLDQQWVSTDAKRGTKIGILLHNQSCRYAKILQVAIYYAGEEWCH